MFALLTTRLGNYSYHIHTNRVSETETGPSRCAEALGHLDPLNGERCLAGVLPSTNVHILIARLALPPL